MDRENHQLIIGSAPDYFQSIQWTLQEIEGLMKRFQREFLQRFHWGVARNIAKTRHCFPARPDQLDWPGFAGEKRKSQYLLPVDHSLKGGDVLLGSNLAAKLDD